VGSSFVKKRIFKKQIFKNWKQKVMIKFVGRQFWFKNTIFCEGDPMQFSTSANPTLSRISWSGRFVTNQEAVVTGFFQNLITILLWNSWECLTISWTLIVVIETNNLTSFGFLKWQFLREEFHRYYVCFKTFQLMPQLSLEQLSIVCRYVFLIFFESWKQVTPYMFSEQA